jgi:hypothetical protein
MKRKTEHPIAEVLREQGRLQTWLARKVDRTPEHVNRVIRGIHPATPEFRQACANALGLPASVLFRDPESVAA